MNVMRTITLLRRPPPIPLLDADWRPWCTCTHPRWQPVLLFDTIPIGCHECRHCGKPDRAELGTTSPELR